MRDTITIPITTEKYPEGGNKSAEPHIHTHRPNIETFDCQSSSFSLVQYTATIHKISLPPRQLLFFFFCTGNGKPDDENDDKKYRHQS